MSSVERNNNLVKISLICVNREIHISYPQQKDMILNKIRVNPNFNKWGQIWQTLESGGMAILWLHLSGLKLIFNFIVNYPVLHYLPLRDRNDFRATNAAIGHFQLLELLYEEIERIQLPVIACAEHSSPAPIANGHGGPRLDSQGNQLSGHSTNNNHPKCAHIFLGLKTLDKTFNIVLEENWKDWTGARHLYLNLSSDFGLSKICLFRRILPNDSNSFMYILIADCTHINEKNRLLLLDFVDRFRLQRLCGYLTVYTNISNDIPNTRLDSD